MSPNWRKRPRMQGDMATAWGETAMLTGGGAIANRPGRGVSSDSARLSSAVTVGPRSARTSERSSCRREPSRPLPEPPGAAGMADGGLSIEPHGMGLHRATKRNMTQASGLIRLIVHKLSSDYFKDQLMGKPAHMPP